MRKKDIINIVWKPLFAAVMTGILSKSTGIDPIIIGLAFGIASSASCYFDIRKITSKQADEEN